MDLSKLTKQKTHSIYSWRWGCAETVLINITEITRNRRDRTKDSCTIREVDSIVGNWDRTGNVTVCNYEQIGEGWRGIRNDHIAAPARWKAENDKMSHCLIEDWSDALRDVFWSLEIEWRLYRPADFRVLEYTWAAGGSHFCLEYDDQVINPDPAIDLEKMTLARRFMI
jgi:hypothetical protein